MRKAFFAMADLRQIECDDQLPTYQALLAA